MCGIFVAFNKSEKIDGSACRRAFSNLTWRGPDSSFSFEWEDRLFYGQTILSITGEPIGAKGSHLKSKSGNYHLVFNGEIYNFLPLKKQFLDNLPDFDLRYGTDTEVLVNLHEVLTPEQVQSQLDGMFSYVVFDFLKRKIFISRDVQGEKSLFIYEDSNWLVISSEIKPITTLVPDISIDYQALRDYFRTRHLMLSDRTVYRGIRNLMPGHLETFDLDSFKWSSTQRLMLKDWIDPQRYRDNMGRSTESLVDELDDILNQCTSEMVPKERKYAVVVSGGVDSSLLAHYFVTNHKPDKLIAVNHVGKDLISCDLTGFKSILGRNIETIEIDMPTYSKEISRCQSVCGGPLYSHSFVPQSIQSARVQASGCCVLIGGEGADELFGGYDSYLRCIGTNGAFSPSPYTTHRSSKVIFSEDDPALLEKDLKHIWTESLKAYSFVENEQERTLLAAMYCDAAYQLPAVGLRGADFMSMMWSIETRSVYVRKPIVQFALNLPLQLKVDIKGREEPLLRTKPLLKKLFLRYFPKELLVEKQGFSGFPNESALYLGAPIDYKTIRQLKIKKDSLPAALRDRDSVWKLINVECFLRGTSF
jgi:asparagine synthase (glutamine-hydrolysing)